jgi:hypothetical protein
MEENDVIEVMTEQIGGDDGLSIAPDISIPQHRDQPSTVETGVLRNTTALVSHETLIWFAAKLTISPD